MTTGGSAMMIDQRSLTFSSIPQQMAPFIITRHLSSFLWTTLVFSYRSFDALYSNIDELYTYKYKNVGKV